MTNGTKRVTAAVALGLLTVLLVHGPAAAQEPAPVVIAGRDSYSVRLDGEQVTIALPIEIDQSAAEVDGAPEVDIVGVDETTAQGLRPHYSIAADPNRPLLILTIAKVEGSYPAPGNHQILVTQPYRLVDDDAGSANQAQVVLAVTIPKAVLAATPGVRIDNTKRCVPFDLWCDDDTTSVEPLVVRETSGAAGAANLMLEPRDVDRPTLFDGTIEIDGDSALMLAPGGQTTVPITVDGDTAVGTAQVVIGVVADGADPVDVPITIETRQGWLIWFVLVLAGLLISFFVRSWLESRFVIAETNGRYWSLYKRAGDRLAASKDRAEHGHLIDLVNTLNTRWEQAGRDLDRKRTAVDQAASELEDVILKRPDRVGAVRDRFQVLRSLLERIESNHPVVARPDALSKVGELGLIADLLESDRTGQADDQRATVESGALTTAKANTTAWAKAVDEGVRKLREGDTSSLADQYFTTEFITNELTPAAGSVERVSDLDELLTEAAPVESTRLQLIKIAQNLLDAADSAEPPVTRELEVKLLGAKRDLEDPLASATPNTLVDALVDAARAVQAELPSDQPTRPESATFGPVDAPPSLPSPASVGPPHPVTPPTSPSLPDPLTEAPLAQARPALSRVGRFVAAGAMAGVAAVVLPGVIEGTGPQQIAVFAWSLTVAPGVAGLSAALGRVAGGPRG